MSISLVARRFGATALAATATISLVAGVSGTAFAAAGSPTSQSSVQAASAAASTSIARDDFTRTIASGWGSATSGGVYTASAATTLHTTGTIGVVKLPRAGSGASATLSAVSAVDSDASIIVSVPKIPTAGNGITSALQVRSSGKDNYQASVRIAPKGALYVSIQRTSGGTTTVLAKDKLIGPKFAAGQKIALQVRATGTTSVSLSARAYINGTTAPTWQSTVTDASAARISKAGGIGVWTYVSGATAVQAVSYDNLAVSNAETEPTTPPVTPTPTPTTPPVTPTPTPTTPPVTPTPTPTTPPVSNGDAGAAPIGSTNYAIPAGAIFVANTGSNSAVGNQLAPLQTVAQAVAKATPGSTIVIRGGTYHETIVVPKGKQLTIQSYPGEAVWFDGSKVVSNWAASGNTWVSTGWTTQFDSSPTYSRGAPDGTAAGWQFVDPAYPMASHPDQTWINGTALAQVKTLGEVTTGKFYVDYAAQKLYIGSDPSGKTVKAADTIKAFTVVGAGSTIRGIGIRNYSPSVPDMGAFAIASDNVTVENVAITDSATTAINVFAAGATLNHVTVARSGLLGAQSSQSDNMVVKNMLIEDNNSEHFNRAPVSGGFKVHKSRHVSVTDSVFRRNLSNSLWFDESVYDITVTGNEITDGTGRGVLIELSATAVIANNFIARNTLDGIYIVDSGQVDVWNNTVTGNARSIIIGQGDRRASQLSTPGHDNRQKLPDPTVTWITGNITVNNNVFADGTFKCILCVEDYSHERSAAQMNITSDGNVYQRSSASMPAWAVVWSRGVGNPAVYTNIPAFAAATGQDTHSYAVDGTAVLNGSKTTAAVQAKTNTVARPLPAKIAAVTGKATGSLQLGAWR